VINLKEPITTPDTIFVQGILETGAAASLCFRTAQSLVDDTGYRWIISGTEGEIGVTMRPGSWSLGPPGKHIRVKNWKRNVDEEVEFAPDEAEYISVVQYPGTNTARMYEAFAEGDMEGFASFESALRTHRLLDRIARGAAVAP
jgi:predicted dehydrogenase